MALGPRLDLRQSQSLVMTPQLQQAIRLLALSNLELESFITEEIEKNPLLESATGELDVPAEPTDLHEPAQPSNSGDEPLDPTVDELVMHGDGIADAPLDMDLNSEDFHQDSAVDSTMGLDGGLGLTGVGAGTGGNGAVGAEGADFDSFAAETVSLHDHLRGQAGECLGGGDLVVADRIIDQIDETGWFLASLLDIAQRLGVPLCEVER